MVRYHLKQVEQNNPYYLNYNKMRYISAVKVFFLVLIMSGLSYSIGYQKSLKDNPQPTIVWVESQNEMLPSEYVDDFIVVLQQGNTIHEMSYDVVTSEVVEVQSYELDQE